MEEVLENLHTLQQAEPSRFQRSKFKINKRGSREQSRIRNFISYLGPDSMTRKLLERHAIAWTQDPSAFWSNSELDRNVASSPCPQAQLVEVYVKAKCGDA